MKNDLDKLRVRINKIDLEIIELISRRTDVAEKIGKIKKRQNVPIINRKREAEVLVKISKKAEENGLNDGLIRNIWKNIIKLARMRQR